MAVLGVHIQHGFRDPELYPPILSSIAKVARFMVVQHAERLAQPSEEDEQYSPCGSAMSFDNTSDSGYESDGSPIARVRVRGGQQHTSFAWVQRMVQQFMVRGTASPMQWLLDLRTYGLKIHYNTTTEGHVHWPDKHTLGYKQVEFTMDQFRGMVHQLLADTRQALLENVLFVRDRQDLPSIPWTKLFDDPSNRSIGWSWLKDQRNQLPVDGQEWLY